MKRQHPEEAVNMVYKKRKLYQHLPDEILIPILLIAASQSDTFIKTVNQYREYKTLLSQRHTRKLSYPVYMDALLKYEELSPHKKHTRIVSPPEYITTSLRYKELSVHKKQTC